MAKSAVDNCRAGRAAKGSIPVDRTTKKEISHEVSFFVFTEFRQELRKETVLRK
jgi:hypothetical protein